MQMRYADLVLSARPTERSASPSPLPWTERARVRGKRHAISHRAKCQPIPSPLVGEGEGEGDSDQHASPHPRENGRGRRFRLSLLTRGGCRGSGFRPSPLRRGSWRGSDHAPTALGTPLAKTFAALSLLALIAVSGCAIRRPLVVAAVSCESRVRETEFNLDRIEYWARKAAEAGADLAVFPECGIHGWWQSRENRKYAEPIDGPSIERLIALADELDIIIAAGMTELEGDKAYITHVLLDGKGLIGKHRKSSLAGGENGEGRIWDVGDDTNVFQIKRYTLGIAICFESVHPETCAALKKKGVEVILAPYANGTDPKEITDPERKQRKWIWERVKENRVWYVACDATPHAKDRSLLPGAAFVINPDAELVACTPEEGPGEAMVVWKIRDRALFLR